MRDTYSDLPIHTHNHSNTVSYNGTEPPKLGDRIVNLYATGVPFGLRGTIVAIHSNTGYAEVSAIILCTAPHCTALHCTAVPRL
jgi:Xrn1 SH3-like domain